MEKAWRVIELDDLRDLVPDCRSERQPFPPVTRAPVGWLPRDDGRVTLARRVPLGVLARVAAYLAAVQAPFVITPSRLASSAYDLSQAVADIALRVLLARSA